MEEEVGRMAEATGLVELRSEPSGLGHSATIPCAGEWVEIDFFVEDCLEDIERVRHDAELFLAAVPLLEEYLQRAKVAAFHLTQRGSDFQSLAGICGAWIRKHRDLLGSLPTLPQASAIEDEPEVGRASGGGDL